MGPTGPQGTPGPTGPTGPTGESITFSTTEFASATTQFAGGGQALTLGTDIISIGTGITYTPPSTITLSPGSYFILATAVVSSERCSDPIGMSLFVNGTEIPSASLYYSHMCIPDEVTIQHLVTVPPGTMANLTFGNASGGTLCYDHFTVTAIALD